MDIHRGLISKILFPLHERLVRRPTFSYLKELEETQWLSKEELETLQMRKAESLLRLAHQHCPWHAARIQAAELPLDDNSPPFTLANLRRLPLMDSTDARMNRDKLVWKGVPGGAHRYNTGGSTGRPIIFYFGRRRQASDAAGRMRARRWWGVDVGDREVYLWGAPVELQKTDRIKTLRDRLFNQLVLNAFEMSPPIMDSYTDSIRAFKPKCIYGYASSIALLAAHAKVRGVDLKLRSLRVVCTTGEPLFPAQRNLIGEVFGVPVANEFGSRDIGFTAHETPRQQMLLMSESVVLEVLDERGQPVKAGDAGEAVITGLCSEAQPFIRYRTGDIVRTSNEPCKDGRGLQVISEIIGRSSDFIVRSDGAIMHPLGVIYILRECEGVAEFKIVQHGIDEIGVHVVPNQHWASPTREQIVRGLKLRLGDKARIEVHLVDSIAPELSGKRRQVVSHVPIPGGVNLAESDVNTGLG